MKRPADENPILLAIVEAELEAYRKLHSPEMLDYFRRELMAMMAAHPYSAALLRTLAPDPQVQESGTMGIEGDEEEDQHAPAASGEGPFGRRR